MFSEAGHQIVTGGHFDEIIIRAGFKDILNEYRIFFGVRMITGVSLVSGVIR